jgi:hypothetical protein
MSRISDMLSDIPAPIAARKETDKVRLCNPDFGVPEQLRRLDEFPTRSPHDIVDSAGRGLKDAGVSISQGPSGYVIHGARGNTPVSKPKGQSK